LKQCEVIKHINENKRRTDLKHFPNLISKKNLKMVKKTRTNTPQSAKILRKIFLGFCLLTSLSVFGQNSNQKSKKTSSRPKPILAHYVPENSGGFQEKTKPSEGEIAMDFILNATYRRQQWLKKMAMDSLKNVNVKPKHRLADSLAKLPLNKLLPVKSQRFTDVVKTLPTKKLKPVFSQRPREILKNPFAKTPTIAGENVSPMTPIIPIGLTPKFSKNVALGLNLGISNGIGVDVAYRFAKHFAAKLAVNYADFEKKGIEYSYITTVRGEKLTNSLSFDAATKLSSVALNLECSFGRKGRFRLIGGAAYFPTNTVTVGGQVMSGVKFNDVVLNTDDIGRGDIVVGFSQQISPYIGMGFGRTFPRKRLNLSFEVGTQYKGDYKVNINVKEGLILKENESNAAALTRNFNEKWYGHYLPVVNFRLAYRLF
jgi:hypothetical protein